MTANEKSPLTETPSGGLSRRTLVKGAAWSLPVVAVAAAAPAYAASACAGGGGTQTFNPPASTDPASVPFVVPAGVTEVQYTVVGGAGGGKYATFATGGAGAKVTGTLPVTPGETLTIFAAQGGRGDIGGGLWSDATDVIVKGGRGWGNGGDASYRYRHAGLGEWVQWHAGGSGGGASAVLRGSTPLIVAAGGGGAGTQKICFGTDGNPNLRGADADKTASLVNRSYTNDVTTAHWSHEGGYSGESAGRGGNLRQYTPSSAFIMGPNFGAGSSGTAADANGGGNGGYSSESITTYGVEQWIGATGGGGGGGYHGGGAGESASTTLKEYHTTTDTVSFVAAYTSSSGGGGGSSYLAPGINGTIGNTGIRPQDGTDIVDGYVILTWNC